MEIIFHAHNAPMSEQLQRRARRSVTTLAERLGRPVDAIIRFDEDGPSCRVEITLHAPRRKPLVASGTKHHVGVALTDALSRLATQVETVHHKRLARRGKRA